MRVAILCGRFGIGTGTGGVAHRLALRWRDQGHEVLVVARRVDATLEGVAFTRMGSRWMAASRVPRGFARLALDRVPHCHVARASGGVHAAWLKVRGGVLGLRDRAEAHLDRVTARTARTVACGAWSVAADVVAYHGVPAAQVERVPTGVSASLSPAAVADARRNARRAWGVDKDGRVALFVGHGFRRKGLATAIRAFDLAAGPADRLVVCGRDRRSDRYAHKGHAQLGDRFRLLGPVDNVPACLAGADAMLLPSRYDASSNAVLEALAAGVPPVASLADGSSERIPDRALVVGNPADVQGFARALRYAWGNAGALGERCRSAGADWSEARMADRLMELLGETLHA